MKRVYILFLVIVIFFLVGEVKAGSLNMVWVIIDQISLDEIIAVDTPNIDYLQQKGAFGLMNVRTTGHLQPESTYLSAGSGNRCQGSKISQNGKKHGKGALNARILELQQLNEQTEYQAEIGRLGEISAKQGIKIAVLGNSDTILSENRTILTMVMDKRGFVPYASINKDILRMVNIKTNPWGYVTDWEVFKKEFLNFTKIAQAIVIETGDMTRIEKYRGLVSNEKIRDEKTKALKRIDNFLGFILNEVNLEEVQIGIIVPTPPPPALEEGKRLSFLLVSGRDTKEGWLTSLSTRRKGIISITDLVSLFMQGNMVNLLSPSSELNNPEGENIGFINQKVDWLDLKELNEKIVIISNNRPIFVKGFILFQLFLILLSIIKIFFKKLFRISIFQKVYEYLLLALSLVPLNYIFISNTGVQTFWQLFFLLIFITIVEIYILLSFVENKVKRILIPTGLLVIVIIFDLFIDFGLMADSLLGYSSVIGARYYGLGNEYMGLFIGSVLISSTGLLELKINWGKDILKSRIFLIPVLVIMTYFIGAPVFGANFGGTITALFSGGITYYYLHRKYPLMLIFFSIVILIGIIYLNFSGYFGPRTHIGKAVELVLSRDWQEIKEIIFRKISMNVKLLRWTIWSRVLLAFIILLILLFKHPVPIFNRFLNSRPFLAAAFYGALFGSIVTMVVNDSGVVAAATLLFYPLLTLLYFL